MFLEKFIYTKNGVIQREINFHRGLNLILNIDNESGGNSIGKSTLGRVIDYLFLAKLDAVYMDKEFKKPNPFVYELFLNNDIQFEIVLKNRNGRVVSFRRNAAVDDSENLFWMSGESVQYSEYASSILNFVFGNNDSKPTVRNMAPKFIRNSHEKMQNTLSFLDVRTRKETYNQLFPFLFGFTGMNYVFRLVKLNKDRSNFNKRLAVFRKPHNEATLARMLKPIDLEIKRLQEKLASLNVIGEAGKEISRLTEIQNSISELSLLASKCKFTHDAQARTRKELESQVATIDLAEIQNIYEYASVNVEGIQKTYEQAVDFHNKLIEKKIKYINETGEELERQIAYLDCKIKDFELSEAEILSRIKNPEVMDSIINLQTEISQQSRRRGEIEGVLKSINEIKKLLVDNMENSDEIKKSLLEMQGELNENIDKFNIFFAKFSKELYNENYIFSLDFNIDNGNCEYGIASFSPSPEGGKKKGEISAFDLAYIELVNEINLNRPMFIMHDSIEDIDHIQIETIFSLALSSSGQYIVSVLRDKLSSIPIKIINESTILELSPDSKFFLV